MFEWLFENSWALWLSLFLVLAVIEMLTLVLFFIMMSVGALAALVADVLGAPFWVEVVIFCLVALAMIFFVRPIALRHLHKGPGELRTNITRLIGQSALVTAPVDADAGQVKIGGDIWSARSKDGILLPVGEEVKVAAIDGATAIVAPLPAQPAAGHSAASTGV